MYHHIVGKNVFQHFGCCALDYTSPHPEDGTLLSVFLLNPVSPVYSCDCFLTLQSLKFFEVILKVSVTSCYRDSFTLFVLSFGACVALYAVSHMKYVNM
jgi:hypothetical protein